MIEQRTDRSPEGEPGACTPAHMPETKQLGRCSPVSLTLCVFPGCLSLSVAKREGKKHEAAPTLCKKTLGSQELGVGAWRGSWAGEW